MDPGTRKWLELRIDAAPALRDALGSFLFDLGSTGLVEEDFGDATLKAYFPPDSEPEQLRHRVALFLDTLHKAFPETPPPRVTYADLPEAEWHLTWRQFYRPERISDRLTVIPAWEPVPPPSAGHVLRMDPGPAFGTGKHATTRLCLRALETLADSRPFSLLDVGTGSGILAIYGALLGAKPILAIDHDPEALRWARRNVDLNGLAGRIDLAATPLAAVDGRFRVVLANIILNALVELMPHLAARLAPDGRLVLSGVLVSQVPELERALVANGLKREAVQREAEWACLTVRPR